MAGIKWDYDDDGILTAYDAESGEKVGNVTTMGDLQPEVEKQK